MSRSPPTNRHGELRCVRGERRGADRPHRQMPSAPARRALPCFFWMSCRMGVNATVDPMHSRTRVFACLMGSTGNQPSRVCAAGHGASWYLAHIIRSCSRNSRIGRDRTRSTSIRRAADLVADPRSVPDGWPIRRRRGSDCSGGWSSWRRPGRCARRSAGPRPR